MARTLVVKVGTSTLTDASGRLDDDYLASLSAQVSQVRRAGWWVVLVSSGAIRAGAERLGWRLPLQALRRKQAAAAVGQSCLMERYSRIFERQGQVVAQVLLSRDDAGDRLRYLNTRQTLDTLIRNEVLPIVNENDTVAVDEIQFGDNDTLGAMVAAMVEADLLLMLTNVPGLLDAQGEVVARAQPRDPVVKALAGGPSGNGSGGMITKFEAARIAAAAGIRTVIAGGREPEVVPRAVAGEAFGTEVLPSARRLRGRKHWIAFGPVPAGSLTVNVRAFEAVLREGGSLLPAGVLEVTGLFQAGDAISLRDEEGREFARGVVNCGSAEAGRVLGRRTADIAAILGEAAFRELVHRDNLVILEP